MPTVLAIMAHPDDIEITCAGTLTLLKNAGWDIHLATMTPGDLGSSKLSRRKISEVRRGEGKRSAELLSASYTCLEFDDLTILCNGKTKKRICNLMRKIRADLVITHPPVDYMMDHEETSRAVREAAFASTIPNWKSKDGKKKLAPCTALPVVLYADPIENVDHAGVRVAARQVVDITTVIDTKEMMLAAHESQRSWLRDQHGEDEYLLAMRRWSADRARDFKQKAVLYAEGFNQHLGHSFPKTDLLTEALGKKLVKTMETPSAG
ncbi:MAG TPA: PIG-L family deacetylase [Planctomycetota bacterium]|nr:PIG-L family deacetylase [Planctomycetota bacterium]